MKKAVLIFSAVFLSLPVFAQLDFDLLNFQESFREGVLRFHRGSYNEAILSFQKSLSLVPDDHLAREWLGRAYYFSGYEDAALNEWRRIESQTAPFLRSFIDSIEARKSLAGELREDWGFLVVEEFQAGEYPNAVVNPGGIAASGNGDILLNSFGTNNINVINQNGRLLRSFIGGFTPLSGPFDIELYEDRLYVTNFLGDYISVLNNQGNTITRFGSAGIGDGQLIGPQYLSVSAEPALYVSDLGNQRVVKFSLDGEYLFHFGEPAAFRSSPAVFAGFTKIGGLAAGKAGIYVANNFPDHADILFFDHTGNILERFPLDGVLAVEDLGITENGQLIIVSRTAVYLFDPLLLSVETLYEVNENENAQFVSAGFDDNNNLLVSDFRNNRLLFLSRLSGIYSGYHVEILRVDSSSFPQVLVEVSVRDVLGHDILGLDVGNFILTEEGLPLGNWSLEYNGSKDSSSTVSFIIEASNSRNDSRFRNRQQDAVFQTLAALPEESELRLFSAGLSPVLELDRDGDASEIATIMASLPADQQWKLDQAIRLAGDRLILDQYKREIVFVGGGSLPDWAFDTIGLAQTLAYLRTNQIRFNLINIVAESVDPALAYLVEQTNGGVYTVYQPQGMAEIGRDFLMRRSGRYVFAARALFDGEFGRKYLPIEVEVTHFTKSGRDESGYFAPLAF